MGGVQDPVGLVLEDMPERAALMYQRMPEKFRTRVFWAQTVEECIDILKNYRERLIFVSLDHDLGGMTFVDSSHDDTGMEVVRWLEKQEAKDYEHVRFVVHSWNLDAAFRMCQRLTLAGYDVTQKPFGS